MSNYIPLLYMGIMFVLGILIGIVIENEHQKTLRAKFRANSHINIEEQMRQDGWKI
jgi:uncharacterized protein YneF (UPF0154 family)